jgi:hypothetical protein
MKRTLRLRSEALAELTVDDLAEVVAGNVQTKDGVSCPIRWCLTVEPTALTCVC